MMAKCGEVLLTDNRAFIFICVFCNEEFNEMLIFGKHVQRGHLKFGNNKLECSQIPPKKAIQLTNEEQNGSFVSLVSRYAIDSESEKENNVDINDLDIKPNVHEGEDDDKLPIMETLNPLNYETAEKVNTFSVPNLHITGANDFPLIKKEDQEMSIGETHSSETQFLCLKQCEADLSLTNHTCTEEQSNIVYKNTRSPQKFRDKINFSDHSKSHLLNIEDVKQDLNIAEIDQHKSNHPDEVDKSSVHRYLCPQCPKRFPSKWKLTDHIYVHSGERPHTCTHCSATFKRISDRSIHIRRCHLKGYKCDFCGKEFGRNVERKVHMRIHTGEKPYQCEECGKSYRTSSALAGHKKRHTNNRTHKCEVCSKTFFSRQDLGNHFVIHSGERPHRCEICFVTFPRKRALRSHMQLHSGIKEYVCSICAKDFAQYAGLYAHMKSHGDRLG